MKQIFKVTITVDPRTPISPSALMRMIQEDIGSWQGSLPPKERIHITHITVVRYKDAKR